LPHFRISGNHNSTNFQSLQSQFQAFDFNPIPQSAKIPGKEEKSSGRELIGRNESVKAMRVCKANGSNGTGRF
jgi:hypothetical protein